MHGAMLHFMASAEPEAAKQAVISILRENSIAFGSVSTVAPTMEDAFVKLKR